MSYFTNFMTMIVQLNELLQNFKELVQGKIKLQTNIIAAGVPKNIWIASASAVEEAKIS